MSDPFFAPYTPEFYAMHLDAGHAKAYRAMAKSLMESFRPSSVVDVGCGLGNLLSEMREIDYGLRVVGVEAPQSKKAVLEKTLLAPGEYRWVDLREASLYTSWIGPPTYDLAVSVEVAEHLPAEASEQYVRFLCSLSDTVFFSGAHPGQGGTGHINEQLPIYWLKKFAGNGFNYSTEDTEMVVSKYRYAVSAVPWYAEAMVFHRRKG